MGTSRSGPLLSDWPDALQEEVESEAAHWLEPDPRRGVGEREWDDWYVRALAAGISEELATLGRALMREAIVRAWDDDARAEAGLFDEGEAMIELAFARPDEADRQWSTLLETSGKSARR